MKFIYESFKKQNKNYIYENRKLMKEAYHFGGAYDIGDYEYFTKEDIIDFADLVLYELSKKFNREFDVIDMNMAEDGKIHELYLEIEDQKTGETYEVSKRVDMRKIKLPRDLNKVYVPYFVGTFANEIQEREIFYTEEFTTDDFKHFDKKQLDKMIDGADEYKGPDKKSAVRAMKAARKYLSEDSQSRGEIIGYMTLTKDDPDWCNYASSPKYDETVMAKASTVPVTIYPYSISKKELGHSAYWAFDAIDNNGRKDTARTSCYIYNLNKFLYPGWHNQILEMANGWTITDKYPYLIKNN